MASTNYHLASLILAISCFIQPSLQNTHYASANSTVVVSSVQPCHLYGDSDIYGIGVRLSFYIQWGTIIIALIAGMEDEIKMTRRGFNVVSLAVLINTFISATNGSFAILELYIVSTLVVFLSSYFIIPIGGQVEFHIVKPMLTRGRWTLLTLHPDDPLGPLHADPIGIGILALIDAAFLFAQPWLYFVITRQGSKPGCSPKVWVFFTSITLYSGNWIRFLKFVSVVSVIAGVFLTVGGLYAFAIGIRPRSPEVEGIVDVEEGGNEAENLPTVPGLGEVRRIMRRVLGLSAVARIRGYLSKAQRNGVRLVLALVGASFIAFVEETIKVNHIDLSSAPLKTTSQLLPFLVALFSAVSLIWVSVRKLRKEGKVIEDAYQERLQAMQLSSQQLRTGNALADLVSERTGRATV